MNILEQPSRGDLNSAKKVEENPQEPKKKPENIYEFFEQLFGHEIFFIDDLMLLDGENKKLLHKFLNIKINDPDKRTVSSVVAAIVKQQPGRIEKFPFYVNNVSLVALRMTYPQSPILTKRMAVEVFSTRFTDFLSRISIRRRSDKKEERNHLSESENAYYQKLKTSVQEALKTRSYFGMTDCPASKQRKIIIQKLLTLGLVQLIRGNRSNLESCTFGLPEE